MEPEEKEKSCRLSTALPLQQALYTVFIVIGYSQIKQICNLYLILSVREF